MNETKGTNEMTLDDAKQQGRDHFRAGKLLTPYDCRAFDAVLFGIVRSDEFPTRRYAEIRGAFNDGFMEAHASGEVW